MDGVSGPYRDDPLGGITVAGNGSPAGMSTPGWIAAIDLQAQRGAWAFAVEGAYIHLVQPPPFEYNSNPGGGVIDSGGVHSGQWSVQGLALRRVGGSVEIALGAMVNGVTVSASSYGAFMGTPFATYHAATTQWALPVAGLRWTVTREDRWHVFLFGEGGYLGSDNNMLQVVPSVGYLVSPNFEVGGQVRILSTTYRTAARRATSTTACG